MMKITMLVGAAAALLVGVGAAAMGAIRSGSIEDGPQPLSATRSLGRLIQGAGGRPVHITYVHGIRATGENYSRRFRERLVRHFGGEGAGILVDTRVVELGAKPTSRIGERLVWERTEDWHASRPFIDRYRLDLPGAGTVIVDEVNWWPLVFPLKCRALLLPEHHLAGSDAEHLKLCARQDGHYHRWISDEELSAALGEKPKSGGGSAVNRKLKHEIMNWGLSDAVIALGTMRPYFASTMEQAFGYAEDGTRALAASDTVVISESLGSFIVMDSYVVGGAARRYLDRTQSLYFLANQFALLELARIDGLPRAPLPGAPPHAPEVAVADEKDRLASDAPEDSSPVAALARWGAVHSERKSLAEQPGATRDRPLPKQVIAFSDPSDLLTYRVPCIRQVTVANVYVRNEHSVLGVYSSPMKAHTGHLANDKVWDIVLGEHERSGPAPQETGCAAESAAE
jgi:hypothetical protein